MPSINIASNLVQGKKSINSNYLHWFFILLLFPFNVFSQNDSHSISYQDAAKYTHLLWKHSLEAPIHINLLAINNFSGIPIEQRSEITDYYSHGKIPEEINLLTSSLVQSSHQFILDNKQFGDYQFQFSIDRYYLPHKYAPDDSIWKEFKAEVDRWAIKEKPSSITLSLRILSANKTIMPWSKSVVTKLSHCDMNTSPQPLLSFVNDNSTLIEYLQSTPAQAFIASTNYLLIEALKFLKAKNQLGVISKINGNEFLLQSKGAEFELGDQLPIYQVNNKKTSPLPLGLAEVVKTWGSQAVAYPTNFKVAHARVGDQVEMNIASGFKTPSYRLITENNCGQTPVIQAAAY